MKENLKQKDKGITLIALIVTIIVLLILAGVTIGALTGNNNVIDQARNAKEESEYSQWEEQIETAIISAEERILNPTIDDVIQELINQDVISDASQVDRTTGAITTNEPTYVIEGKLDDYITPEEVGDGDEINIDENGVYTDENGDTAKIPEGFEIIEEASTINEGLNVQDDQGNQYVWIPVDGIMGENGKTVQNAVDGEIILGRYVFDEEGNIDTTLTPTTTIGGTLKTHNTDDNNYIFTENTRATNNTPSNDINGFIQSVRTNGGYYIAKFEASEGENGKAQSKYDQTVWTDITQQEASEACQSLYTGINSDLMNSYAWDTAILFIQKYGQNNYSRQFGNEINSSMQTAGLSGDMQLSICDMAGNCWEWTTETCRNSDNACVYRGGFFENTNGYTCVRVNGATSYTSNSLSFRPILYL